MTEKELIRIIVDELKEYALAKKRENNSDNKITKLSKQVQDILTELPKEKAEIINQFISLKDTIADSDCRYLYTQGAKDCVKLLKRLDII